MTEITKNQMRQKVFRYLDGRTLSKPAKLSVISAIVYGPETFMKADAEAIKSYQEKVFDLLCEMEKDGAVKNLFSDETNDKAEKVDAMMISHWVLNQKDKV
jgi:hypothetical protein